MVATNIHLIGIDPGGLGTTGWALFTVPRESIFGYADPSIEEWDYGEFQGDEVSQALEIARLVREVQSLDFRLGPALVIEDWDSDPNFKSRDEETLSPVRIGAMLRLLQRQKQLNDATITFQSRQIPFTSKATTDDRLKKLGLYVAGSDHIRSATKHAIIALRRANESPEFAAALWPYAAEWAGRTDQGVH